MSLGLSKILAKTPGGRTLADMKALAPGARNSESTSAAPSRAVKKRQEEDCSAYGAAARSLDAELDSQPGSPEPVESELGTYNL